MNLRIFSYDVVSSTQDVARLLAERDIQSGIVLSQSQTKGRGRFSRLWHSEKGGLYCTIFIPISSESAHMLPFIASLAVRNTLAAKTKSIVQLKWPNDVLLNGKKVAGILTEVQHGNKPRALIGIGINVNQKSMPKPLAKQSTSLFIHTHKKSNIPLLLNQLKKNFISIYSAAIENGFSTIIADWKKHAHMLNKRASINTIRGVVNGKALDIDANGNLIIQKRNGKKMKILEGDVTLISRT